MTTLAGVLAGIGARLDGTPLAVMLDVDGTLAPIVPRYQDARVPDDTRAVLEELTSLPGVTVALVSGRAAEDTMRIAGVRNAWVVGNHGFEVRSPDGQLTANEAVVPYAEAIATAAATLDEAARAVDGATLENKRWTLSLHYRLVADAAVPALVSRAEAAARSGGLRITQGKRIVELRPPVAVDKGTASLALAERLGALGAAASLMFAGDDRTDEDAFRALRGRKRDTVTIRIHGDAGDDVVVKTDAEFALGTIEELRELLGWLAQRRRGARRDPA